MIHTRAPLVALAALLGLALPSVGYVQGASGAPSQWRPIHEEASEVFEACPGLTVLWELTVDARERYVARGADGLPLYEAFSHDVEVYTNLANGAWVTVDNHRSEHPLQVTDNGDGTLRYLYQHTDHQVMYDEDGKMIAQLRIGSIVIEKTWDHEGTPTDPTDDQLVSFGFPNGFDQTGRNADFCTELVKAIG